MYCIVNGLRARILDYMKNSNSERKLSRPVFTGLLGCSPDCLYTLPDISSVSVMDIFSGAGMQITNT